MFVFRRQFRQRAHRLQPVRAARGNHHGQRFVRARFFRAQARDGDVVARVAYQVVAADALDRDDLAGAQGRDRLRQRGGVVAVGGNARRDELQARPAGRAGDRFGMKPAVERVFVFAPAFRAHGERRHAGVGPVIGKLADERVTWPALGAVDERMTVAAIIRIAQLAQAVVAGEIIRRHVDTRRAIGTAGKNLEGIEGLRFRSGTRRNSRTRQRRRLFQQGLLECLQRGDRALCPDLDRAGLVAYPAAKTELMGEAIDERAEAHALHAPADCQAQRLMRGVSMKV